MDYLAAKNFMLEKLRTELSDKLYYHGLHHTLDVLNVAAELCALMGISAYETMLVKTAVLFHDAGFTQSNVEHERIGCEIAQDCLPPLGYTTHEIARIQGMIMATKIPQSPQNTLEAIICDADLDYLGRSDFYAIGQTLYQELRAFNIVDTIEAWDQIQVRFLENHTFCTPINRARRTPVKEKFLEELRSRVAVG
jgi:predicted metal-dependent HD superfamily phosphohydrolase